MPYKANKPRRHKIPKARNKIANWVEYDAALRRRGSLSQDLRSCWQQADPQGPPRRARKTVGRSGAVCGSEKAAPPVKAASGTSMHVRIQLWPPTVLRALQILLVDSEAVRGEMLRRADDGTWPAEPELLGPDDTVTVDAINFSCRLRDFYATTKFAMRRLEP